MNDTYTDERLAELRKIAEAATEGPWEWDGLGDFYGAPRMQGWLAGPPRLQERQTVLQSVAMDADCDIEASNEDAAHIAAFDPPTVLALLDEVERLREEMDDMVNKDWHGLMAILEDIYPEDTFPTMVDDPERDAGPRIISLLRVVDGLRRRLDDVEARHAPVTVRFGDAPGELARRTCGVHYEYPVAWPCPTAKAARW